tara:strand:- start:176 stop:1300 length:1125 start_codon:yes stop_codon:yes gene_type:complete
MIQEYQTQSTLNPNLWDDNRLKPKLRENFLKIAKSFADFLLPIIDVAVKDVTLTGSNANYNWTNKSDIDLHILINYKNIKAYDANSALVREYLMTKKSIWNNNYPLMFRGMQIELYAQDVNEPHASTGVYSIMHDKWIKKPSSDIISVEDDAIDKKAEPYAYEIDKLKVGDVNLTGRINRLKNRLKKMRQAGLAVEGEYSIENLAFKKLRNSGHLEKLSQLAKSEMMTQLQLEKKIKFNVNVTHKPTKITTPVTNPFKVSLTRVNESTKQLANHISGKIKLNNTDWKVIMKNLDAVEHANGQWDYPNRCTMIPSNNITMKNVGYPVLGIDDTGYKQVMHPEQNYTYPGHRVFEIPITRKHKHILKQLNNYIKQG